MTDRVGGAPRSIDPAELALRTGAVGAPPAGAPSFADAMRAAGARSGIQFSGHALDRIERRGIEFDPARMARLEDAVTKAAAKGSRDSLVLIDELALVVSVRNRTVITAVDAANRKENVFTNIDSVVIT